MANTVDKELIKEALKNNINKVQCLEEWHYYYGYISALYVADVITATEQEAFLKQLRARVKF